MDFSDADAQTLVSKIESLDLSPQEQAALSALLDAAEAGTDDVAGFGSGLPIGFAHGSPIGTRMFNVLGVQGTAGGTPDGIAGGPRHDHLEIHQTAT